MKLRMTKPKGCVDCGVLFEPHPGRYKDRCKEHSTQRDNERYKEMRLIRFALSNIAALEPFLVMWESEVLRHHTSWSNVLDESRLRGWEKI